MVTVCGLLLLQALSVCVSVCPAFMAYIFVTVGRILIKLGENVGTQVRWIVLKFKNSAAKGNVTTTVLSRFGGLLLGN